VEISAGLSLLPFFLLGVLVVAGLAIYAAIANSKRRERLFAAATARGWTYTAEQPELVSRWTGTPFGRGDSRHAREVLSGSWRGAGFWAFTYSYETSSTDSKGARTTTTHRYAVTALALPAYLPTLEVAPESLMGRFSQAVGIGSDIDVESEDFNRTFRVESRDRKFASDVLTPRLVEALLAGPRDPWRIEGPCILTWDTGTVEVEQVDGRLAALQLVVSAIPAFVWKDHGYDPQIAGPDT
jgi:hypothetical protein